MDYKKVVYMHLAVLLGCVLPLGNIWGPLLVTRDTEALKSNMRNIVGFQTVFTILLFIGGVVGWYMQIQRLAEGVADYRFLWVLVLLNVLVCFIYPLICSTVIFWRKRIIYFYPRWKYING